MMSRRKAFIWITLALILFISASGAYANNQWTFMGFKLHWEKKDTAILTLSVGNNHNGQWPSLLNDVGSNWNIYGGSYLAINVVPGGTGDVESYNDNYGNTGWLGLASVWINGDHIIDGESKVNEYYINLNGYEGFDDPVEWQHVLCQEIGHTFGLDHHSKGKDTDTCMNDQTRPLNYPLPNSHDTKTLDKMYEEDHADEDGGGGGGGPGKCHPVFGCGQGKVRAFWAEHYEDEQELFEASDAVVEATVLSSNFSHMVGRPDRAVPITKVRLKVNQTLKGNASRVILLQQTRGPGLEIEDDPGYVTGDGYTLFLRQTGAKSYRVVNPNGRIRH